jgi:hypothetical protein
MAKVMATIQVEFETADVHQARAALARLQGGVKHSIEVPAGIAARTTGIVGGTVVVNVAMKSVDGQPG